jgi:hypothetical protein
VESNDFASAYELRIGINHPRLAQTPSLVLNRGVENIIKTNVGNGQTEANGGPRSKANCAGYG